VVRAFRALGPDQRMAAYGALGLLASMLLPWYATTGFRITGLRNGRTRDLTAHDTQTALQAFTWVEAAILLVALGVLVLLFARAERRAFHLPGGDGAVVTGAGAWVILLVIWRLFDKPTLGTGVAVKLHWGIFVALIPAVVLCVAGQRMRAAHRPEPPLPGEAPEPGDDRGPGPRRRRAPVADWTSEVAALSPQEIAARARRAPRVELPSDVPRPADPPPPSFTERRRRRPAEDRDEPAPAERDRAERDPAERPSPERPSPDRLF
jgi:hypothetical protein